MCTDKRINSSRAQYRYGKIESALFFSSDAYRGAMIGKPDTAKRIILYAFVCLTHTLGGWLNNEPPSKITLERMTMPSGIEYNWCRKD
jgi:hypothetical protein